MKRAAIAAGAIGAAVLVLVTVTAGQRARNAGLLPAEREGDTPAAASPEPPSSAAAPAAEAEQGFLYGRVTTYGGVYEGRLRWGDGSEAFWGDYFNGAKDHNPWSARVPPERLPKEREAVAFFGLEIAQRDRDLPIGEQALDVVDAIRARLHVDQPPERAALDPVGRQMVGVRLGRYDGQW